jgi:hypothetical protein
MAVNETLADKTNRIIRQKRENLEKMNKHKIGSDFTAKELEEMKGYKGKVKK